MRYYYIALCLIVGVEHSEAMCPFLMGNRAGGSPLPAGHPEVKKEDQTTAAPKTKEATITSGRASNHYSYYLALAELDLEAVKEDLRALFLDSKESWPADYG